MNTLILCILGVFEPDLGVSLLETC